MQPFSFHDLGGSTYPQVCGKTILHFELLDFAVFTLRMISVGLRGGYEKIPFGKARRVLNTKVDSEVSGTQRT